MHLFRQRFGEAFGTGLFDSDINAHNLRALQKS
jgi:hypothetical protein